MKTNKEKQKKVLLAVLKMLDFESLSKTPLVVDKVLKLKKNKALIRTVNGGNSSTRFYIYVNIELPNLKIRLITPNLMNSMIEYNFKY